MDDYIKREDALSAAIRWIRNPAFITDAIKTILAADVRENMHADWIYQDPLFVDTIMCSVCGYNLPSDEFKTNFCPDCGADMRGEKDV